MKQLFCILFLIFLSNSSNSQTISGKIVDSISQRPLELANISFVSTNYGVFTDHDGNFKINISNFKDSVRISNIGYFTKIIDLSKFKKNNNYDTIIALNPKTEALKEIIIFNRKVNYSWDKLVKSNQKKTQYLGFQFGSENCRYIDNPYHKKGKIKSVILDLRKVKDYSKPCVLCKVDYITSYNIKFYSFDSINKKPGNEIYDKNIIIDPENKTCKLTIDVDSLNITFPKNGVCIGVETINTKYKDPKRAGAFVAPILKFSETPDSSPIMSWVRYRTDGWNFKPLSTRDRKGKKFKQNILVVDLEVKIEKQQ